VMNGSRYKRKKIGKVMGYGKREGTENPSG